MFVFLLAFVTGNPCGVMFSVCLIHLLGAHFILSVGHKYASGGAQTDRRTDGQAVYNREGHIFLEISSKHRTNWKNGI